MGFSRPEEQKCGVSCEQYTLVLFLYLILSVYRCVGSMGLGFGVCAYTHPTDLYGGDDGAKVYA